jgi:hypothetical protein
MKGYVKRLRATNLDLDVDDNVHRATKDDPIYLLSKEMDGLLLPHMKCARYRSESTPIKAGYGDFSRRL